MVLEKRGPNTMTSTPQGKRSWTPEELDPYLHLSKPQQARRLNRSVAVIGRMRREHPYYTKEKTLDDKIIKAGAKVIDTLADYLAATIEFEALVNELRKTDPEKADAFIEGLQQAVGNA